MQICCSAILADSSSLQRGKISGPSRTAEQANNMLNTDVLFPVAPRFALLLCCVFPLASAAECGPELFCCAFPPWVSAAFLRLRSPTAALAIVAAVLRHRKFTHDSEQPPSATISPWARPSPALLIPALPRLWLLSSCCCYR